MHVLSLELQENQSLNLQQKKDRGRESGRESQAFGAGRRRQSGETEGGENMLFSEMFRA